MRKQIVSTMHNKNNLKYILQGYLSPYLLPDTKRTYQLGLLLRRFFWILKCLQIYSFNGIPIQMSFHCSINPRTFIWVQNIHSKLWVKNLWTHDKTETFWFQIHESAFYRLSSPFWPLFLFQQLLKKKKCVVQDNFTHLSFPESSALSQLVVFELQPSFSLCVSPWPFQGP